MPDDTPLDAAHRAMVVAPDDDAARLSFYAAFADVSVVLLLAGEDADSVTPALVTIGADRYVTVFDTDARLAAFAGVTVAQATLAGRGLAEMLAGQGIGIALNPDVAPSAMLIPPAGVDWLAATLAHAPVQATARPVSVAAPGAVPEALLTGLTRRLTGTGGLAQGGWLVAVTYDDGRRGHLLAFVGALPDAEPPLAIAANEALVFSGIAAGALDVTFVDPGSDLAQRIARVGRPVAMTARPLLTGPAAPGLDPDRPPRLR